MIDHAKQRCRWSGWPGAWCLDCGREDPREIALAEGRIQYDCKLESRRCRCTTGEQQTQCPHFGPVDDDVDEGYCAEPGSNRHNPYEKAHHGA